MNGAIAGEDEGKFYFSDGFITIETTELLDNGILVYDDFTGCEYKGLPLESYAIREVV